jgi:GntR family transcriptional regulator
MVRHVGKVPPFDLEAAGPVYKYVAMADHLQARIEAGDLAPGSMLPAEKTLAAEYEMSLGTARKATAILRERGLVVTLPSKGTFIRREPPPDRSG